MIFGTTATETDTLTWWSFLCAVSLFNVLAWIVSVAMVRRRHGELPPWARDSLRLQVLLSAVYVLGCAYRSALPVYDIKRLCLVDSWFSSVMVGRSVATCAELCFAGQWALLMRGVARTTGSSLGMKASRLVVPMIAVAELCSWDAVLTTSNFGHVLEESLWGLSAALLVATFVVFGARCRRDLRSLAAAVCIIGLGYVIYMFEVDVPMYWARSVLDGEQGRPFFSIVQGMADASGRWVVSYRWEDWRTEFVWMSLYFSVGVWLSISLMHVPALLGVRKKATINLVRIPNAPRSRGVDRVALHRAPVRY